MSDRYFALRLLAFRLILALPFAVLGFHMFGKVSDVGVIAAGGFGCAGCLTAAIILWRPIAELLVLPFGNMFFPDDRASTPPPNYSIPESRVQKGEFEEALFLYHAIAEKYPQEVKPWLAMLDVAAYHLKDTERAETVFREGMGQLEDPECRRLLQGLYARIGQGPSEADAWYQRRTLSLDEPRGEAP